MSRVWISEYRSAAADRSGTTLPCGQEPALARQCIDTDETTVSQPFASGTHFICVMAEADVHVAIGETPQAEARDMPLIAFGERYYGVQPGHRLCVMEAE